jgi:hypothetical protein
LYVRVGEQLLVSLGSLHAVGFDCDDDQRIAGDDVSQSKPAE